MVAKDTAVSKYVFELSEAERDELRTLMHRGKHASPEILKARILLKADRSMAGEAWSDSQIADALETSVDTVVRTRKRLVEEGLQGALARKHSLASARNRIIQNIGPGRRHVRCPGRASISDVCDDAAQQQ